MYFFLFEVSRFPTEFIFFVIGKSISNQGGRKRVLASGCPIDELHLIKVHGNKSAFRPVFGCVGCRTQILGIQEMKETKTN